MKKYYLRVLFIMATGILLAGCATQKSVTQDWQTGFTALDLNALVRSGEYVKKVDNFLVILDSSGSMAETYKGKIKLNLAKDIISRMNRTIPDLKFMAALRMFGRTAVFNNKKTELLYGLTQYSRSGLEGGLNMVNRGRGDSPLVIAINAGSGDLQSTRGQIAVIIVSDGKEMDRAPVKAAQKMKGAFGDRVCIYTIVVGNDPDGKKLLENVAKAGKCGFSVSSGSIASSAGMAGFVEKVFLTRAPVDSDGDGVYDDRDQCPDTPKGVKVDGVGCPLDTDGDGVYDYLDKCPGTPKGVKVDSVGCPLDTDGDGVYDYLDKCPGTPRGARVDERGCWILKGVYFDTNKAIIKTRSYPILNEVVTVLKNNPYLKVEVQGHTDNRGSAMYNQKLSERRAKAVMNYLIDAGIAGRRLTAVGYGLSRPVVANTSPENWAKNRRVQLKPIR